MEHSKLFQTLKGTLIVSCQALPDEPLHGSEIMAKMAEAAYLGGASGIRANSKEDIVAIKKVVDLPVIGLIKKNYEDSEVFITPTASEVDQLIDTDAEIVAIDSTIRKRPRGERLDELISRIKRNGKAVMADISTYDEGVEAVKRGVDCLSTTLSGYTGYSVSQEGPDFALIEKLAALPIPVFAEGKVSTPEQAKQALSAGAHAVVVGSAITRPQLITKSFAHAIKTGKVIT
ncbi:MAG TPA: N-acetylmannosamine-6-phosphate 2-epimerase [Bacillales bacterium]